MQKQDIYQSVTDAILAQLEAGCVPWVKPWKDGNATTTMLPNNGSTGKAYSGINIPLLWIAGARFGSQSWLTFKQAVALGGSVMKGEKGTAVVYADRFLPKGEDAKPIFFLKSYTVFNVAQCSGLAAIPEREPLTVPQQHDAADALIANTGARLLVSGDRAYYSPSADHVVMPPIGAFLDPMGWYQTTFHELGHWTGHASRLDRQFGKRFGDHAYAVEELTAEMTSAFLCATIGVEPAVRHADYLANWIAAMKADNKAIVAAASKASKAADYIQAFEAVRIAA